MDFHNNNDDQEDESGFASSSSPSPQQEEEIKEMIRGRLRETITRRTGLDEDEIAVLFKTDEQLRDFVIQNAEMRRIGTDYLNEDETSPEPGDDETLELSGSDKRDSDLLTKELRARRKKRSEQEKDIAADIDRRQAEAFDQAGIHLPPESRVSWAELLEATKELDFTEDKNEEDDND